MEIASEGLSREFRTKLDYTLKRAREHGLDLRVYALERDPWVQAKLWRQSRSAEEVETAVAKLYTEGAPFLAEVLKSVGPQYGRWATNNLPGLSWHQYGEAADVVLVSESGRNIWASRHKGYETLAVISNRVILYSGFYWRHQDANHLQLRPEAPRAYYDWSQIDQQMRDRYGRRCNDQDQERTAAQA